MNKLKSFLHTIWGNDLVRRVFHTFWQAAGGVVLSQVLFVHSTSDVKGLLAVALAAGLAAVKALIVSRG